MKEFRQYFIGGPMDGKDATEEFPSLPYGIRADELWTADEYANDPDMNPDLVGEIKNQWLYMPHRFTFGGIIVTYWADERLTSREVIACRLAELIMAPHLITTPQMETEGAHP